MSEVDHMPMSESKQCCCNVYVPGHFSTFACSKPATVTVGGKRYCPTHNPEAVVKRRARNEERWRREAKERDDERNKKKALEVIAKCAIAAVQTDMDFTAVIAAVKAWEVLP